MPKVNRYLTKSRFILALECPTKLFYTRKPKEYADQKKADSFMFELAKGGMQIGELAKFYFIPDPISADITVHAEAHEYDKAITETNEKLQASGRVVIAEASFLFNNCYVRADIIVKTESGELELYEVKSKSYREGEDKFIGKSNNLTSEWSPYLHDVAFQKWVIENSTGKKIKAYLSVVDKDSHSTVPGLAKYFTVSKGENDKVIITTPAGLSRKDLGAQILKNINVDGECDLIYSQPLKFISEKEYSFVDGIEFLADAYLRDVKIISKPTSSCGKCEFYTTEDVKDRELKSGQKECWVGNAWISEKSFIQDDLVFELWGGNAGGGKSPTQKLLDLKKYLLKDALREDFDSNPSQSEDGLGNHDRREQQILRVKSKDSKPYVDKKGLMQAFDSFKYPFHFIDFETTATALPWFKDMRPYQGIAFQFSHHIVQENGRIEHKDQYLSFEPGVFPNFDFVRKLRASLNTDNGTIFRYHIHENSYLNFIYGQLDASIGVEDKDDLQQFIRSITEWTEIEGKKEVKHSGPRNMVDLYKVVLKYYYSPHAKGSNSLKQILPAATNDFPFLKEKYSRPIYGKGLEIASLNFDKKVWITEEFQNDPYKTLEPVFSGYSAEELDKLVQDTETIGDGGSAMMAYNMLQYSEIPLDQRIKIKDALLKYCELDTMAMVMLYEGLKSSL